MTKPIPGVVEAAAVLPDGGAARPAGTARFVLLGPLEVHDGRRTRTPRAHKLRVLLAILLVRGSTVVPVDTLIHELWGDSPPRTALKALRVYVSQLRRVLDGLPAMRSRPRIVTRDPGYRLELGDGSLDLLDFERLCELGRRARGDGELERASRYYAQAVDLWRGPPLADVRSSALLEGMARWLEESRVSVLEQRFGLEIRLGRYTDCIAELRALVTEYPLHERLHSQLMVALCLAGRKADALQVYRGLHATFVEELGMPPSRDLQVLHQAILGSEEPVPARWDLWVA